MGTTDAGMQLYECAKNKNNDARQTKHLCAGAYINELLGALARTHVCRDTVMLFQVLEGNILDVQHDADLTGD